MSVFDDIPVDEDFHISMHNMQECTCERPLICCSNRGCFCSMCGGIERLELSDYKMTWTKPVVKEVGHVRPLFIGEAPKENFETFTVNVGLDLNLGSLTYRERRTV